MPQDLSKLTLLLDIRSVPLNDDFMRGNITNIVARQEEKLSHYLDYIFFCVECEKLYAASKSDVDQFVMRYGRPSRSF